jgi:hypothetical protein
VFEIPALKVQITHCAVIITVNIKWYTVSPLTDNQVGLMDTVSLHAAVKCPDKTLHNSKKDCFALCYRYESYRIA